VRRPLPPVSGEIALLALACVAACNGNLRPIGAPFASDGAGVTDGANHTDMSVPDTSVPIGECPDRPVLGFATMSYAGGEPDGGTDAAPWDAGGVGPLDAGTLVVVDAQDSDALLQFSTYAGDKTPGPLTILVKGMITIPPPPDGESADLQKIRVSSNKTVIGANLTDGSSGSGFLGGGLVMTGVSKVTIRNLVIAMPNSDDSSANVDAIHIEGSTQIWVDHCDLSSNGSNADAGAAYDDLVGISDKSDFVTVSWTRYHAHHDTGLVGRSDSAQAAADDKDKDHVTFDHDYFYDVASGPRVRFGTVHVLNCLFQNVTNWGVASIDGANVRIESTAFQNVTVTASNPDYGPVTTILSGATEGSVDIVDSPTNPPNGKNVIDQSVPFALPYPYAQDMLDSVPPLLRGCAGTGHVAAPTGN
jgi:pectate lyase